MTCVQTPLRAQRLKRWNAEFQFPNRSGKSRQGTPVLAIQKMALRKSRLSAVTPGSPLCLAAEGPPVPTGHPSSHVVVALRSSMTK